MRRRDVLAMAGSTIVAPALSLPVAAGGPPLLVWFASSNQAAASRWIGFLKDGLRDAGYVEGQHYRIEARYAEFNVERLPAVAEEVIGLEPAIIVAGAVDTAFAARQATSTIPIVSGALADAVHLGLVESYAHPGGNLTGITPYIDGLPAKQIEFAREVMPNARRIGLIGNLNDPKAPPQRDELTTIARKLGVDTIMPKVDKPDDLADAVNDIKNAPVDVVIVLQTTMLLAQRKPLAQLLGEASLPAVYGYREHVDEGGLVSYGVDLSWCWRHVASFLDRILKGASPGDLPVEFPPKIQMVVNLKTAKALGLTLTQSILARADEVIE
jgi:putative ABC transport system substrate-binding protein